MEMEKNGFSIWVFYNFECCHRNGDRFFSAYRNYNIGLDQTSADYKGKKRPASPD